ncbi:MAG: SufD family Fe-S cluster assembly protein [Mucinivorans sp.]
MKNLVITAGESLRDSFMVADCASLDCDISVDLAADARADLLVVISDRGAKNQKIVAHLGRGSELNLTTLDLAGDEFERHTDIFLDGDHAFCTLNGVFVTSGSQKCSNYIKISHLAEGCVSHQNFRGVASGLSHAFFRGHIYVDPLAQDTVAEQTNHNILINDRAVIDTQPVLEIYADRVTCNHGATVGREDPQAMFYLRQRGISISAARALLIEGFCHSALPIDGFEEDVQLAVSEMLTQKLEAL